MPPDSVARVRRAGLALAASVSVAAGLVFAALVTDRDLIGLARTPVLLIFAGLIAMPGAASAAVVAARRLV